MRVAVAQIRLSESLQRNKDRILSSLDEAKEREVRVINYPETALSGYLRDSFSEVSDTEIRDALKEIEGRAKANGLYAIIGTAYWDGDVLRNSAAVVGPDMDMAIYHKNNLVWYEDAWFKPGNELLTFSVDGIIMGVMICRDQNFPEFSKTLKDRGARCLFQSSAHYYEPIEARMKQEKNIALPIVRAYENQLYMCKSNSVGPLLATISYGNSVIVDPRGIVLQRAGTNGEEILTYDIDFDQPNPSW